ncbi:uncharacterized protein LOC127858775 [Dreissena polymorpha]|uniref:uncharacterized protein LOC127858775 n=1 Tax=Dreissena polymorpha TaxID=45954 RepID=UPI002263CD37|nr:uncharacterized protein LOC127858775 [Dreissena polymorpha]
MKTTLAVLGLALFAVLAECKPAEEPAKNLLRERILEKLTERGLKKGGRPADGDEGLEKGGRPADGDDVKDRWPYGWLEFAGLYAKCESGKILVEQWGEYLQAALEAVDVDGEDSVLANACPHVMEAGRKLAEADEEGRKAAEKYLNLGFPLTQCANLMADKESLSLTILLSGGDPADNEFLKGADELFELCDKVFENVEAELRDEEDEAVDAAEGDGKRVVKTLLNHFRK